MKLNFDLTELDEDRGDFEQMTWLLETVADGWHVWCSPDPDGPLYANYFSANPRLRELVDKSFMSSTAYGSTGEAEVHITDQGQRTAFDSRRYPIQVAARYVKQPLEILVENVVSDGHLYLSMLRAFDPELATLFDLVRPAAVFTHAGGKPEIKNLVPTYVARRESRGYRPRLVVIVDSDAKYPGHSPSETNDVASICDEHSVPFYATEKRASENYIPDAVVSAYGDDYPDVSDS